MNISDILTEENTLATVNADTKKRALELVSRVVAKHLPNCDTKIILDSLLKRERISSTGIGHGVAIPHGQLAEIEKPLAIFLQLTKPIDFNDPSGEPIDLLFALFVPEAATEEHSTILASIANIFREKSLRKKLRHIHDKKKLYQAIINHS